MKFMINAQTLLNAVQSVFPAANKGGTLPVLNNILMKADESGLTLQATNLEIELTNKIELTPELSENGFRINTPGEITVPAKKIFDICRAISGEISVSTNKDSDKTTIKCGQSRFSLLSIPASDFPSSLLSQETVKFVVDSESFRAALNAVSHAEAKKDIRYYLNGVCLEFTQKGLTLVATDGHRLALETIEILENTSQDDRSVIIPSDAVGIISKLLSNKKINKEETLSIFVSDRNISITVDHITLLSKLVDGKFPDFNRVIPKENPSLAAISKDDFIRMINRVKLLANENSSLVFSFGKKEQETICHIHTGGEYEYAEDVLPITYHGADVEIGLNANYIIEAIESLQEYPESGQVRVELKDPQSSILITGHSEGKRVIMPVRL